MQRQIGDEIRLGETVTPFKSIDDSKEIDRTASDSENADQKVAKIERLVNKGEYGEDVARYIPDVLNFEFQGMIENVITREQPANSLYSYMQNLEFRLMIMQNHYTNPNSFHLCILIKIKNRTKANADIGDGMNTVNNFFAPWIKEINVTRYGDDVEILPTSSSYEIYQYSDAMLFLAKKKVSYNGNNNRRTNNSNTPADITDEN